MNQARICGLLLALCAGVAGSLEAAVIYDNGAPTQLGGVDLNANLGADSFLLGSAVNLNLLRYWTLQNGSGSYAGTTEWSVRSNVSNAPGAVLASGSAVATQTPTGLSALGLSEYEHTIVMSVNLPAGTYWLVLHNGPSSSQPLLDFMWGFSNDGTTGDAQAYEITPSGPWGSVSAELAFQLEGNPMNNQIPEPGSLALLGTGLLAFGIYRQRRSA